MSSTKNPNPAQKVRSQMIRAIRSQQAEIVALRSENSTMKTALKDLVRAAGASRNPRFASLMSLADDQMATTTDQARTPDATDSPENPGAVPAPANTGVTPAATTDVNTPAVTMPDDQPLDGLVDVTAPVPGTDGAPDATSFDGDVKTPATPTEQVQDPKGTSGWTGTPMSTDRAGQPTATAAARGGDQERMIASIRLARLQVAAGLAQGEDLALAQAISSGTQPLSEINAVATVLDQVRTRTAGRQPTARQRHLVPQPSRQQGVASLASQPAVQVTASAGDADEWAFGMGGIAD